MKPYYEEDGITIYHGDCREILPTLSPDAIVADPPYGMDLDCDYSRFRTSHAHAYVGNTYSPVAGDGERFDPSWLLTYSKVVLWGMNHFAATLPVGTTLVWIKRGDSGFGSFLSDAEVAWMKGGHGVYCRRDTSLSGAGRIPFHPTLKPVGVMKWCIEKLGSAETICDPYMGSGTTLVAAKNLGREAIGIELEEKYCEIAAKRLAQRVLELTA